MSAQRDSRGRLQSYYTDRELYDVVREVAMRVSPDDPTSVSQRVFDGAREAAGHPNAPSARGICCRLHDRRGRPFSWRELLTVACDPERDLDRIHGRRRGRDDAPELGPRHLFFGLRLAARKQGVQTLTPGEYEEAQRELIAQERRRHDGQARVAELLPSVGQAELIARDIQTRLRRPTNGTDQQDQAAQGASVDGGSSRTRNVTELEGWDRALAVVGLEPRPATGRSAEAQDRALEAGETPAERRTIRRRQREEMPIEEAIHHFVEANGRWPSYETLYEFINKLGIIVESPNRAWHQIGSAAVIEKARAYRTSLGLDSPPGSGARKGRAPRGTKVKVPEGGIPGAITGRTGRESLKKTKDELLDGLERFDLELQPRSVPRTRARYVRFAAENGLPSATLFAKHGGFRKMLAEARERRRNV